MQTVGTLLGQQALCVAGEQMSAGRLMHMRLQKSTFCPGTMALRSPPFLIFSAITCTRTYSKAEPWHLAPNCSDNGNLSKACMVQEHKLQVNTSAPASPKPTARRLQILLMLLSRMRVSICGSPSRRSFPNLFPCARRLHQPKSILARASQHGAHHARHLDI